MQGPATQQCDRRLARVLLAQYKNVMEDPHPNLLAWVDEADLRQWYFLAVGLEEPFTGGEYLFKLTAPDEFPQKPPKFEFLSQNGVYMPGGPICISVGEFHSDDRPGKEGSYGWRPSLGMKGFAREVVNGLVHHTLLDSGIRIIQTPESLKKMYAKSSAAYNKKHFTRVVEAFETLCSAHPEAEPVRNLHRGRALLAGRPVPAVPVPATPVPAVPVLATPLPAAPAPAMPSPAMPAPATPAPAAPTPATPLPAMPTPATPLPAAPAPAALLPTALASAAPAPAASVPAEAEGDGGDSVALGFASVPGSVPPPCDTELALSDADVAALFESLLGD